jgi:hypothetical protein
MTKASILSLSSKNNFPGPTHDVEVVLVRTSSHYIRSSGGGGGCEGGGDTTVALITL